MTAGTSRRQTALVTGANRGIGLDLVRGLLAKNYDVIATARQPTAAKELNEIAAKNGRLRVIELDVSSVKSVETLHTTTTSALASLKADPKAGLDLLINNAGVVPQESPTTLDGIAKIMASTFATNVTGSLLVTRVLLPLLQRHTPRAKVIMMSSAGGSIGRYFAVPEAVVKSRIGTSVYFVSKAALNMLTVDLANEHKDLTFIALHPGVVETDMAKEFFAPTANVQAFGSINAEQSATALINTIERAQHDTHNAKFVDATNGTFIPW